MALSNLERETVILFNEAEDKATVYTYNGKLKRKLERLSHDFPQDVDLTDRDATGSVTYTIPKGLISLRQPMSEERREACRARAIERGLKPPGRDKRPSPTDEHIKAG